MISVSLFPLLLTLVAASPASMEVMIVKQSLAMVPEGWQLYTSPPADHAINMQIGLKEQNLDQLQKRLLEMSDPGHSDYGKHMTKAEIDALTAPSKSTVDTVTAWLSSHGIKAGDVSNGMMPVTVSVSQAEKLLDTRYSVYHHAGQEKYTVRTTKYSLPKSVHSEISMIQPTTMFSDMGMIHPKVSGTKPPKSKRASSARCGQSITPACLRQLYNINGTLNDSHTSIGIAGYLGQVANLGDLSTFIASYSIKNARELKVELVNGGTNNGPGTVEADLDVQYTVGISSPVTSIFYSTAGQPPFKPDSNDPTNTNEPYLEWLNYVLAKDSLPQTMTSSYGDNEQTVPKDYAENVCNLFMKLGARGVSFLCSSGDGGVSGGQSGDCQANDGSGKKKFIPTFPAGCPWVTAVGGTRGVPESAATLSTGGFSEYFKAPDYQANAASGYVSALGGQYSGLYNPKGRGFPDVAAQAEQYEVIVEGMMTYVDGTSCSSPTFAAVVALLNDYRVSQGRAPLGFLNPWLYGKATEGLNDITSGNNPGCGTDGFSARTGWDPVTGLGTPNFGKLKKLV